MIERAVILTRETTIGDAERTVILDPLNPTRWRISGPGGAAYRLGPTPTALHAKMTKLGIRCPTPVWEPGNGQMFFCVPVHACESGARTADVHSGNAPPVFASIREVTHMSYDESSSVSIFVATTSLANELHRPRRTCPECKGDMTLHQLRDYGTPGQPSRGVMWVSRWECACGSLEVISRAPLV